MNDWDEVTVLRKKPTSSKDAKSSTAVNQAMRTGNVETAKKFNAGTNKAHQTLGKQAARIEEEDIPHVEHVSRDVGLTIQKARLELGMKQSDLAQKIYEKASVIADFESGKAVPDQKVLASLQRVLKVKLTGKNIGAKLDDKPSKG